MGTGIHHTLKTIVQLSNYDDTCNGIFKKKALACTDIYMFYNDDYQEKENRSFIFQH